LTGRGRRRTPKDEVDPVRHLIVTATGWGLNPDKDAIYLNITPGKNDGKTVYKLDVKDVPVDGSWSITLYNAEGYLVKNDRDAYSFNNITAKKKRRWLGYDSVSAVLRRQKLLTVCRSCLVGTIPSVLYRPRKEILDGTWKFSDAQPQ